MKKNIVSSNEASVDVSVIMPTFRREKEVLEAIQSALSQADVRVEVIVLDDSPEGSAEAGVKGLGDARIRYLKREPPSGGKPAQVRNEGLQMAQGRYVYFLDDDDHVLPGALAAMSQALDRRPRAGVAFGRVECFGGQADIVRRYQEWFGWAAVAAQRLSRFSWLTAGTILFRGTLIINSVCMMRREAALALGGYDDAIPVYEDVEFFLRGIRRFGHVFVNHPVLHYRTGAPSLIHNLKGDARPIAESYRLMHHKYRREHGPLEYRALQMAARLLPLPPAPER